MDCGRRPHLPKICAQSNPPLQKTLISQISLNSAAAMRASEKTSISTNRKSTTCFSSSHRWTLCVTPKSPKEWLKTRIFTFGVAFHFFVAGNRIHFKLNVWVEHSTSQLTDDKTSLKWAWPRQVTYRVGQKKWYLSYNVIYVREVSLFWPTLYFKPLVPPKIHVSLERLKLEISNLVCMFIIASPSLRATNCPWKARGYCHVTSLFFLENKQ